MPLRRAPLTFGSRRRILQAEWTQSGPRADSKLEEELTAGLRPAKPVAVCGDALRQSSYRLNAQVGMFEQALSQRYVRDGHD